MNKQRLLETLTVQKHYLTREMNRAELGFKKGYFEGRVEQCQLVIDALNAPEDEMLAALIKD